MKTATKQRLVLGVIGVAIFGTLAVALSHSTKYRVVPFKREDGLYGYDVFVSVGGGPEERILSSDGPFPTEDVARAEGDLYRRTKGWT